MGKIRFNLRNPSDKGKTPIYMVYQDKSKPLVYPVGLYASAKEWDKTNYCFKGRNAIAKKSNEQLDLYKLELQTILLDMKMNGERFTKEKAKKALDRRFNAKTEDDTTIFGFCKIVHKRLKGTVNQSGLPRILQHIETFDKQATFDNIDTNFYNRFCDYLFDQNFYRSTVNTVLTQFIRLWKLAIDENLTKNKNVNIIKKFKTKTDHVALTLNDVRKIYDFEITKPILKKDIQVCKDIKNRFLLSCFTGLRRSDWNKIQKSNIQTIDGYDIFVIKHIQKTDVTCAIPLDLFPLTRKILDSYNDELPKLTIKQFNFVNPIISEICKQAGLKRLETVTVWKRKKEIVQKQLFELISPHTARRTFVTTLLNKGFSENEIKKMTGHKSSASFSKYDKQKTVENAVNISRTVGKLKAV